MSFQTKTFLAIVASMVNRMRTTTTAFTDYNVGSAARTMVEAPAQEIDQLYQEILFGLQEAIETSVYTSFNFPALPALPASNLIRVSVAVQSAAVLIVSGSLFTTTDGAHTYVSTADTTIAAGASFVDVPTVAQVAGSSGNVPALTAFTPAATIPGFIAAQCLSAFSSGTDAESPSARKIRFNAYVSTLSRGTIAALLYALTRLTVLTDSQGNIIERVTSANIEEPYLIDPAQPPGLVNAYVHNGVGGTSDALVQQAAAVLNGYTRADGTKIAGYKAAGVVLACYAASEIPLNVSGQLTIAPTFDATAVVAAVTAVVFSYIQGLATGRPYLGAVLGEQVMQVPGVLDWEVVTPGPFVQINFSAKLMPATLLILGWLATTAPMTFGTSGALS